MFEYMYVCVGKCGSDVDFSCQNSKPSLLLLCWICAIYANQLLITYLDPTHECSCCCARIRQRELMDAVRILAFRWEAVLIPQAAASHFQFLFYSLFGIISEAKNWFFWLLIQFHLTPWRVQMFRLSEQFLDRMISQLASQKWSRECLTSGDLYMWANLL